MIFAPRPSNPFREFITTYYARCRGVFPKIMAIGGKWRFEDLIPGLSDFDTRLVVEDNVKGKDWNDMSLAVGQVHTALASARPDWARILEHPPGITMRLSEIDDPLCYSPQLHTWTWYEGNLDLIGARMRKLSSGWQPADQLYHLKRFARYWGPYKRGIDPPINLGSFENKYALHSRYMHYFAPPLQSAVSICLHRNVIGKLEALRLAQDLFPAPEIIEELLTAVECHYELSAYYEEDSLAEVETRLASYLNSVFLRMIPHVTIVNLSNVSEPAELGHALGHIFPEPVVEFLERRTFSRLMTGRLLFFAEEIPGFDSEWLIRNELTRLSEWACRQSLTAFVAVCFGKSTDFEGALDIVTGQFLSSEECRAFREVAAIGAGPFAPGSERTMAKATAEVFPFVQLALERLGEELILRHSRRTYPKAGYDLHKREASVEQKEIPRLLDDGLREHPSEYQ